jgi:hypothetical protein
MGEPDATDPSVAPRTSFETDGSDADIRDAYRREQVMSRRREADLLMSQASGHRGTTHEGARDAEHDARAALKLYRASLDWAEDTDLEDDAHRMMDDAGRWVRETFGCRVERVGREYRQVCPVALGHNRIGLSIGGHAAVRVCSLCGGDLSECEHLPRTAYLVPGGPEDLGWCRVCLKESCDHEPNTTYRVSLVSIIRELDLHEVSIVSKPAHPEARIHSISLSNADLKAALGPDFVPGVEVSCDRCLTPCEGLTKHDVTHG